jgi:hypothetical protein
MKPKPKVPATATNAPAMATVTLISEDDLDPQLTKVNTNNKRMWNIERVGDADVEMLMIRKVETTKVRKQLYSIQIKHINRDVTIGM